MVPGSVRSSTEVRESAGDPVVTRTLLAGGGVASAVTRTRAAALATPYPSTVVTW